MPTSSSIKLLTGNSHPDLAQAVANRLGIPVTHCTVKKFSDNETSAQIHESVRDEDVYILQTGFNPAPYPTSSTSYSVPPTPTINHKPGMSSLSSNDGPTVRSTTSQTQSRQGSPPPEAAAAAEAAEPNGDAPTAPHMQASTLNLNPFSDPNDLLMELLILISACKTASARRITAVLPCFPYARMDRKDRSRAPITAKLVANMLQSAGADHVITMDLHASQIQGFFDIPVDNLWTEPMMMGFVKRLGDKKDCIIVSPDAGGAKRATGLADKLDIDFALINRRRARQGQGQDGGAAMEVLVGDVKDKICVLVDDMCDTGETLHLATHTLMQTGARKVYALVSHGLLSGAACEIIRDSPIDKLIVSNSISQKEHTKITGSKLEVMDVSPLLAESIRRTHNGESISLIFTEGGAATF